HWPGVAEIGKLSSLTSATMNGFITKICCETFWSVFDAEAGVVASAEGCGVVGGEEVEADAAGVHRLGNCQGLVLIAPEDDAAKSELGVIGQADRLIEVLVFQDGYDRPEDFFTGDS